MEDMHPEPRLVLARIALIGSALAHLALAEEWLPQEPIARVEEGEPYVSACFADGGKLVLVATEDGLVRRLDAGTLETRGEVQLPFKGVLWVGTRDTEKSVAAGLPDGTVRVCDGETGKERSRIDVGAGACTALSLAPDARVLATGGADGRLLLWWVPTREVMQEIAAHEGAVSEVAFSGDGRVVTTAGADHAWRVWEVATAGNLVDWDGVPTVGALAFHPSGWRIAEACDAYFRVGYTTGSRMGAGIEGHSSNVCALAFSPDGLRLFSADEGGTAAIWDVSALEGMPEQADTLGGHIIRNRWLDLASSHAAEGLGTVEFLLAHADEFIEYATERDKPIQADEAQIRGLVKSLSDEWEAGWACQELEQLGEAARPYLAAAPDGEEKSLLLATVGKPVPRTPFALRNLREVHLMESIGSEKARALLRAWAGGHPLARLTQDARAALRRLERR